MWAFAKSVLFGTVVAAVLPMIFTLTLALGSLPEGLNGDGRLFPSLWLGILPLVVTFPIVLGSSIIFGLPLAALLRRNDRETLWAYTISAGILGFVIPIAGLLIIDAPAGYWMALLGAVSGIVTAQTWWDSTMGRNDR